MTRDEIYNHLAQVYLGKKTEVEIEEKKKKGPRRLNAWSVINIGIVGIIFVSVLSGLTAFLARRSNGWTGRITYALTNGPIRIPYDVAYPHPLVKTFSLAIPPIDAAKYQTLRFRIRALEEGTPGAVRVRLRNKRNEEASVFVEDIGLKWREVAIPLEEFRRISDWSSLDEVSVVIESWNAEKKKGILLIDDLCFAGLSKGGSI